MAVIRVEKNTNYTCMANYHLRDKELSLKAKGLLSVILSLPDDWKYSMAGLVAICKEGESAVKAAFKELEKAGYVTVTKLYPNQTDTGRIEYVYTIRECPQQDGFEQDIENLGVESQGVENRGQLSTYKPSTKESSTKEPKKKEKKKTAETYDSIIDGFTQDEELRDALRDFLQYKVASCHRAKKEFTNRALKVNLTKLSKLSNDPREMVEIVNQTLERSWSGFFPLKDGYEGGDRAKGGQRSLDLSDYERKKGTYVIRDGKRYVYVDEEHLEEVVENEQGESWYDGI